LPGLNRFNTKMWWRSKHTHFTSQSACHSDYPCCWHE